MQAIAIATTRAAAIAEIECPTHVGQRTVRYRVVSIGSGPQDAWASEMGAFRAEVEEVA